MTDAGLRQFVAGTFQANPAYQLIGTADIAPAEREFFSWLNDDSGLYGVLRPAEGSQLGLKSACRETAQLFQALQRPGRLPEPLRSGGSLTTNREIVELVLDGILMVDHNGTMIWGPAAFAAICDGGTAEAHSRLASLSLEALHYGASLPLDTPATLAARLYFYGRIPFSPRWQRLYPATDAIVRCLGVEPGGANTRRLARVWRRLDEEHSQGWLAWENTGRAVPPAGERCYKLYISPRPQHVRDAFDALVAELANGTAAAFKVGRDAFGLLRPDKMVAYFTAWDPLRAVARGLAARLNGCDPHGVPFTTAFEDDSLLLSWGSDPPEAAGMPPWLRRESWRQRVTNQLAVSLVLARRSPHPGADPSRFAWERLRLSGVEL